MTQNFSKNNFINYALSKGYSAKDINTALQDAGMGGYNPLTYSGNPIATAFTESSQKFRKPFTEILKNS